MANTNNRFYPKLSDTMTDDDLTGFLLSAENAVDILLNGLYYMNSESLSYRKSIAKRKLKLLIQ